MNGMKTILTMLVAAYAVPWATKHGLAFDAVDQAQVVGMALAGVAIVMRFVSTGPALGDIRAWLTRGSHPDIPTITDAVIAELLRRKAAKATAAPAPQTQETKT